MLHNHLRWRCLTSLLWVVLLQSIGLAGRYFLSPFEIESDLYGLLYYDWNWPETLAQRIDDVGPMICMVSAFACLILHLWQARFPAMSPLRDHAAEHFKLRRWRLSAFG
ncbi:MAG: hypothetical protein R3C05_04120 [Pirellulaceae bacterium]